ncbi:cytosine/adenosine deaminase zinc-binding region; hydrolase activity [Candidatus Blochmanniella floridana]|uniref:tRNA-specific adenosine deaminase n=1 Tax=Blochmanniella floridana TaxID=203907 RepID=Q7VRR3_BLOFL|nr:cytosine/adenosine deaminase zinc-binding region; hydrolase activity [Candidatus Blochmannia floridanus]
MYPVDIEIIWMCYAVMLANIADLNGDVSVGAVLVYNERLIGCGYNASIKNNDPSAHAEIVALRIGAEVLGNYRLLNTTLYVTLEPCMMCIGAMIHARVYKLVYGAHNKKTEYFSIWNKYIRNDCNHRFVIKSGVLEKICSDQISSFFKIRRRFCRKKIL